MTHKSISLLCLLAVAGCDADAGERSAIERIASPAHPMDAVPSPDGATIYFVTDGPAAAGDSQLYRVPADGSADPTELARFDHARAVVTNAAGTLFVADPGAGIFAVTAGGGAPALVPGSAGLDARALAVDDGDVCWVTGAATGLAQCLPASGGTPETIAEAVGGRLDGLVFAADGTIYFSGTQDGSGALFESDGRGAAATRIASGFTLGDPGGVALSPDQSVVLVSSVSAAGTAQVIQVARATRAVTTFDDVISANVGAGGLHQALAADVYAWVGNAPPGAIYRLDL